MPCLRSNTGRVFDQLGLHDSPAASPCGSAGRGRVVAVHAAVVAGQDSW